MFINLCTSVQLCVQFLMYLKDAIYRIFEEIK